MAPLGQQLEMLNTVPMVRYAMTLAKTESSIADGIISTR